MEPTAIAYDMTTMTAICDARLIYGRGGYVRDSQIHRRMRLGGGGRGQLPSQIRAKQWGKIRAKQEEKIGQRKLKD